MKASPFAYFAPDTVDEAVALLAEHGDDAKILAGGQSLMPMMALRLAAPQVVIDINRVEGLETAERGSGRVRIGALGRHRTIEKMTDLAVSCPMIADAVPMIGHVAIRNRGTVVGSLAHADPAAEWPAIAVALDGEVTAVSTQGTRRIPAEGFFETYLTNTLASDELATHVELAIHAGDVGSSFLELSRRHGDFAVCGAAAIISLAPEGTVDRARVVVCGAADTPLRIRAAEDLLVGDVPSPAVFAEAAQVAFDVADPRGDIHGSAWYRRELVRVTVRRALEQASDRARAASDDD